MNDSFETFTIMVSQNKNKNSAAGHWTTEQLVKALLAKGDLLNVVSVIVHPLGKTK